MTRTIPKPKHGSLEWLELRHRQDGRCVFGASEAPALMGASDYETPLDLIVRKMKQPKVTTPNAAMDRGNVLEPALLSFAEREWGQIVTPDVLYHSDRLVATLDGVLASEPVSSPSVVIEAKTTTKYRTGDPFPSDWYWQGVAQMATTGAERVVFTILDGRLDLSTFVLNREDVMVEVLRDRAEELGQAVDENRLPDDALLTAAHIQLLYPQAVGEKELTDEEAEVVYEYRRAKEEIKAWEMLAKDAQDRLARILLDKEVGVHGGRKVISYKWQKGAVRLDAKALTADHPELVKQYQKESDAVRVFRLSN